MKNKSKFVQGFLLGMLAMLAVVIGIGAGIYFSDIDWNASKDPTRGASWRRGTPDGRWARRGR